MSKTQTEAEMARVWQELSHKVLSVVLTDPGAVFPILDTLGPNPHWFPRPDDKVWAVAAQCAQENVAATVEAVATRTDVPLDYLRKVQARWSADDARLVQQHARELKRLGILAEVRDVGRDLARADDPAASSEIIAYAMARLSGAEALQTNRTGDAYSVGETAWEELQNSASAGIPTGMTWFDKLSGGLWPGFNYWVAAAYKQGKTTLMRNWLLHLAQNGVACDAFCAEGTREQFALDCQAMLATQVLLDGGERNRGNLRLSGLYIRRAWRQQTAAFTSAELAAIDKAREIWNTLNVRVWDTKDGIRNLVTLRHRIQQSKFEYGAQVFFCDYSQLFGGNQGTLFERQSNVALAVQEIATGEGVALVMLAQRNENAINGGGDSYSPGVKGGGDAPAAADFLLIPSISTDAPGLYTVKLKLSRHSETGEATHVVASTCGLVLDKWFGVAPGRR